MWGRAATADLGRWDLHITSFHPLGTQPETCVSPPVLSVYKLSHRLFLHELTHRLFATQQSFGAVFQNKCLDYRPTTPTLPLLSVLLLHILTTHIRRIPSRHRPTNQPGSWMYSWAVIGGLKIPTLCGTVDFAVSDPRVDSLPSPLFVPFWWKNIV